MTETPKRANARKKPTGNGERRTASDKKSSPPVVELPHDDEVMKQNPRTEDYAGFICFSSAGESNIRTVVHVTPHLESMEKWKYKQKSTPKTGLDAESSPEGLKTPASVPTNSEPGLGELLIRARESLSAFHTMISANSVLMPALRTGFIHDNMYRSAKSALTAIESDQHYEIFGILSDQYSKINRQVRRLKELDKGMELMPPAILLSMVATFDSLMSDLVRAILLKQPNRIESSSRTLTVKEILLMDNFDDVRNKVLDDEIDNLMRGSHDEQVSYIESNFSVKIRDTYDRWPEFIEIFERRNLAAHGNMVVNRRYLQNCAQHGGCVDGIEIGDTLELTPKYLSDTADLLLEFVLLSLIVLWRKSSPTESKKAVESFGDELYELIRDGRAGPASRLLDFVLNKQPRVVDDVYFKIMTINLSIATIKNGDKKGGIAVLDKTDWSASSDEFKICEAAIREQLDEVLNLMPIVVQGNKAGAQEFREWPAFDWVRSEPRFKESFKTLFGEELVADERSSSGSLALRLDQFS